MSYYYALKLQLLQEHFTRCRLPLEIPLVFSLELSRSLVVYGPLEVMHGQGEWYFGLSHKEILKRDFFFPICKSGNSVLKCLGELKQVSYDKNCPSNTWSRMLVFKTWSVWEKTHWAAAWPSSKSQLTGNSTSAIAFLCTTGSPYSPGQSVTVT